MKFVVSVRLGRLVLELNSTPNHFRRMSGRNLNPYAVGFTIGFYPVVWPVVRPGLHSVPKISVR